MGKLLEGLIISRLEVYLSDLSPKQYGFWKGRMTTDAILKVVRIAECAKRGDRKKKGFCALVAIDIRNAFNCAR